MPIWERTKKFFLVKWKKKKNKRSLMQTLCNFNITIKREILDENGRQAQNTADGDEHFVWE